jgi:hypothetical protein
MVDRYNKEKYMIKNIFGDINDDILDRKIYKEYARQITVKNILNLDDHPKYKLMVERLCIGMADIQHINRNDEVFIDVPKTDNIYKNEVGSLIYTAQYTNVQVNNLTDKIHEQISLFLKLKSYESQKYNFYKQRLNAKFNTYTCGLFTKNIMYDRYKALKNRIPDAYKIYLNKLILICLLRYESIVSLSYQWALPLKWYEYVYYNNNVKIEGLSSPFNSQLLLVNTDTLYCSLFYDTDKFFGSIGNIYDANFKYILKKYYNNQQILCTITLTSFIPSMTKIANYILNMSVKQLHFCVIFFDKPKHFPSASNPYDILKNSKKLIYYKKISGTPNKFENTTLGNQVIHFNWGNNAYVYIIGDTKSNIHIDNLNNIITNLK